MQTKPYRTTLAKLTYRQLTHLHVGNVANGNRLLFDSAGYGVVNGINLADVLNNFFYGVGGTGGFKLMDLF